MSIQELHVAVPEHLGDRSPWCRARALPGKPEAAIPILTEALPLLLSALTRLALGDLLHLGRSHSHLPREAGNSPAPARPAADGAQGDLCETVRKLTAGSLLPLRARC